MGQGATSPPRGQGLRRISEQSVDELRWRASEYRRMAPTASTCQVAEGLLRLADRFDAEADRRERTEGATA